MVIAVPSIGDPVGYLAGWQIALSELKFASAQVVVQFLVRMAREPCAQVLALIAGG
jgi:hypothetical protein